MYAVRAVFTLATSAITLSMGTVCGQTFYQALGDITSDEGIQCLAQAPNGNVLMGGFRADSALVLEMDAAGGVWWTATFKPTGLPSVVTDLKITPDGFIIGCGNGLSGVGVAWQSIFYFKMDLFGNLLWTMISVDPRPVYALRIEALSASEYLLFSDIYDIGAPTSADMIRQRIDATTGAVIWASPRLDLNAAIPYLDDVTATALGTGGRTYATGRIYLNGAPVTGMRPFVSAFSPSGVHVWSKYFVIDAALPARLYGMDLLFYNDSLTLLYSGDLVGGSLNMTIGLVRMDTLGNVAWTTHYDITGSVSDRGSAVVAHPLGYAIAGTLDDGTQTDQFVITTTLTGNVVWGWVYGTLIANEDLLWPYGKNLLPFGADLFMAGRRTIGANQDLLAMHLDFNGLVACPVPPGMTINFANLGTFSAPLTELEFPDAIPFTPLGLGQSSVILPDGCSSLIVDLGPDTILCDTIILDAGFPGASFWIWMDGTGGPIYTVTDTGTYSVQVYVNCCFVSDTIRIGPGPIPLPDFILPAANCGLPVLFTNTSSLASSYTWDFGDGTTSTATNPVHIYGTPGTYTITLTATNTCTSVSLQQVIVVAPTPVTPGFLVADSSCVNASVSFIDASTGATQYLYDFGDASTSVLASPSHTYLIPGIYTITQSAWNDCDSASTSQIITVLPDPTVVIIGDTVVCPVDSILLTADTTGSGLQLAWAPGGATTGSIWVSQSATTTYTVTATNPLGCSASDALTVSIPPPATLSLIGPDTLCSGESGTLVALSILPGPFTWNTSPSGNDSLSVIPATTTNFQVSVVDACAGDTLQAAHTITVLQPPTAIIGTDGLEGCEPMEVMFTDASVSADPIISWSWDFGDGGTSSDQSPTYVYASAGTFTASLVITSANGCTDTSDAATVVVVFPSPNAAFTVSGEPIEWPDGIVAFNNYSTGDSSWVWDLGNGEMAFVEEPTHQYAGPGLYPIELIVTNEFGCTDTATYLLVIDDAYALYVPNTITVDGDGRNDLFAPMGAGIIEYHLSIFDRWGELLFEGDGPAFWDGTYLGTPVQQDVYVWRIVARDRHHEQYEIFGHVTVLR